MALKSLDFRKKRQKAWRDLEQMLTKVESKGLGCLSPGDVLKLSELYRMACSSLYVTRNISLDKNLHDYLESLVARGYLTIYCSKLSRENSLRNFFMHDFPETVRKYKFYHFAALLFVLIGLLAGYCSTAYDASNYFIFVDRQEERTPYSSTKNLGEILKSGREQKTDAKTFFAGFLFTHNTKVGLMCFSLGVALGLPTIYFLFKNGASLGAMTYVYHINGLAISWWAWILPHGITEFLAIILCGGCGLMIGSCLIAPGKYGRKYRLKTVGREAGITMLGTVGLFFIAGIIEGYFRQTALGDFPRYVMAFITMVGWTYYFGFLGKLKK